MVTPHICIAISLAAKQYDVKQIESKLNYLTRTAFGHKIYFKFFITEFSTYLRENSCKVWGVERSPSSPAPFEQHAFGSALHITHHGQAAGIKIVSPNRGNQALLSAGLVGGMNVPAGCQASLCSYYYSYWKNLANIRVSAGSLKQC